MHPLWADSHPPWVGHDASPDVRPRGDARSSPARFPRRRRVAATSEDVEGLGKATAWLGKDDVAVHDDCYIFRHSLDPRFATHLFASKGFQRQKVQFAAGTKVTRISGANLGRIEVPVPDLADQTVIGQTMSDLDATLDSLTLERSRVRSLRSHALAVLLSGEHEIPKSYDGLMGAAS